MAVGNILWVASGLLLVAFTSTGKNGMRYDIEKPGSVKVFRVMRLRVQIC